MIRYEPIIFRAKTGLALREGGFIFRSAHGEFLSAHWTGLQKNEKGCKHEKENLSFQHLL